MKPMFVSILLIYVTLFAYQPLLYVEDLLPHCFAYSRCLDSVSQATHPRLMTWGSRDGQV